MQGRELSEYTTCAALRFMWVSMFPRNIEPLRGNIDTHINRSAAHVVYSDNSRPCMRASKLYQPFGMCGTRCVRVSTGDELEALGTGSTPHASPFRATRY